MFQNYIFLFIIQFVKSSTMKELIFTKKGIVRLYFTYIIIFHHSYVDRHACMYPLQLTKLLGQVDVECLGKMHYKLFKMSPIYVGHSVLLSPCLHTFKLSFNFSIL